MKKFAFNTLRPETRARYAADELRAQKESAPRKIKSLTEEIQSAKNDGESADYIAWLEAKVEKQKKLLD